MIEIDLIRHVKVVGKSALYGCTDIEPVASENTRLVDVLLTRQSKLQPYQKVICSPFIRCQRLAEKFSKAAQIPLSVLPGLQEMNFGCFDGVAFDDIPFDETPFDDNQFKDTPFMGEPLNDNSKQQGSNIKDILTWPLLEAFFQRPAEVTLPDAEALSEFNRRVIETWKSIIAQEVVDISPKRVLIVAHGGVIRMILAHILQVDWQQASWHQQLQIAHGSLSRISISLPFQDDTNEIQPEKQPKPPQKMYQQVKTISMPLLEIF